jgi:trehalose 6-phosphate synthase/phosphatase
LLWQLKNYIQPELNLQVIDGNKVVEVKKTAFNKGTAARTFVENGNYDFVLAIGDDTTDEDMFEALPDDSFTIKIGDDLVSCTQPYQKSGRGVSFSGFYGFGDRGVK